MGPLLQPGAAYSAGHGTVLASGAVNSTWWTLYLVLRACFKFLGMFCVSSHISSREVAGGHLWVVLQTSLSPVPGKLARTRPAQDPALCFFDHRESLVLTISL
ncbi:hypothetical protein AAY473_035926 [Plecturocebus cupreus]